MLLFYAPVFQTIGTYELPGDLVLIIQMIQQFQASVDGLACIVYYIQFCVHKSYAASCTRF